MKENILLFLFEIPTFDVVCNTYIVTPIIFTVSVNYGNCIGT